MPTSGVVNFPAIKPISECFIKPKYQVEESNHPYYLSPWDLSFLSDHYNQKGLFFKKPNPPSPFSIDKFLESLKDSLSLTLVHFYTLAGQFETKIDEDQHRCQIFINCNKGPGVRFVHNVLDATLSDFLSPSHVHPVVGESFFDYINGEVNYDGHNLPLLSIKVTELVDGLFIGCSMNHVVVDGTSFWHFWNVWCEIQQGRGEPSLTLTLKKPPIHTRWVPDGYAMGDIFLPYTHPREFITRFKPAQHLRCRFFHFAPESIVNLKAKANKELNNNYRQGEISHTISSFQALLALVWRSIIRAKGLARDQVTRCKLAANNRTRLDPPLPKEYFGNSLGYVTATTTVGELLDHELGWAAMLLNLSVAGYTDQDVRGVYESWFESPFVYQLSSVFDANTEGKVQVGSSPRFEVYENEFVGIGKPVAVRSGHVNKYCGKVNVFPGREGEGSVDVEICLTPDKMSVLESDQEFMSSVVSLDHKTN